MENNRLRTPLINSAILLAAVSLIIYLAVSSPGGSIWSAIGAIFYAFFKGIQLAIGLVLALLVCLAVLIGIFFGCVAMVSRESAARMYQQLQGFVIGQFNLARGVVMEDVVPKTQDAPVVSPAGQADKGFFSDRSSLADIQKVQSTFEEKLNSLQSRIEQSEQDESITKLSDWLRAEEQKTEEVKASMELLDQQMRQLQKSVEEVAEKLTADSSADILGAMQEKIADLVKSNSNRDADIGTLQRKVDALNSELKAVQEKLTLFEEERKSIQEQDESGKHRLFSYIENEQEKEKIQQLVTEAMDQEMTYAQATDYLVENVSPDTAKIIADHPALTKEFIRENRKQN